MEAHRYLGLISVRPRMKFVTSPANQVVCYDIFISSVDPDGFGEAIWRLVAANEATVNEQIAPIVAATGENV